MSTIGELGSFLAQETAAAHQKADQAALPAVTDPAHLVAPNGAGTP
jgi:hypothetical protein